jgi:hypothetical protein
MFTSRMNIFAIAVWITTLFRGTLVLAQFKTFECFSQNAQIQNGLMDFEGSRSSCELTGGTLATFASESEVVSVAKSTSCGYWGNETYFYIGLTRKYDLSANYSWITGESFNFANWQMGNPNWAMSTNACVVKTLHGQWVDVSCSTQVGRICQFTQTLEALPSPKAFAVSLSPTKSLRPSRSPSLFPSWAPTTSTPSLGPSPVEFVRQLCSNKGISAGGWPRNVQQYLYASSMVVTTHRSMCGTAESPNFSSHTVRYNFIAPRTRWYWFSASKSGCAGELSIGVGYYENCTAFGNPFISCQVGENIFKPYSISYFEYEGLFIKLGQKISIFVSVYGEHKQCLENGSLAFSVEKTYQPLLDSPGIYIPYGCFAGLYIFFICFCICVISIGVDRDHSQNSDDIKNGLLFWLFSAIEVMGIIGYISYVEVYDYSIFVLMICFLIVGALVFYTFCFSGEIPERLRKDSPTSSHNLTLVQSCLESAFGNLSCPPNEFWKIFVPFQFLIYLVIILPLLMLYCLCYLLMILLLAILVFDLCIYALIALETETQQAKANLIPASVMRYLLLTIPEMILIFVNTSYSETYEEPFFILTVIPMFLMTLQLSFRVVAMIPTRGECKSLFASFASKIKNKSKKHPEAQYVETPRDQNDEIPTLNMQTNDNAHAHIAFTALTLARRQQTTRKDEDVTKTDQHHGENSLFLATAGKDQQKEITVGEVADKSDGYDDLYEPDWMNSISSMKSDRPTSARPASTNASLSKSIDSQKKKAQHDSPAFDELALPPPTTNSSECPICCLSNVQMQALTCGHILCRNCVNKLKESGQHCPFCKKPIHHAIDVYLPNG